MSGAHGHRVASRIKAGTVGINIPYTPFPGIPFGGYKESGFGRELGLETLDLYLETKSVLVSASPKAVRPVRPLTRGVTLPSPCPTPGRGCGRHVQEG